MGAKRGEEVMLHPAMAQDNVAVITGGASGIGLAAAVRFAEFCIKMCIADIGDDALKDGRGKDVGGFSPAFGESQTSLRKRAPKVVTVCRRGRRFLAILTDARFVLMPASGPTRTSRASA
jgi:hypothetical protein